MTGLNRRFCIIDEWISTGDSPFITGFLSQVIINSSTLDLHGSRNISAIETRAVQLVSINIDRLSIDRS